MTTDNAPATGGQGGAAALLDPAAATSTTTTTTTPAAWTDGFDDTAKGYIANKGWKGPADLFQSYQNLEKLKGVPAERLLTLPEGDDPAQWAAVWQKLGRPEKAEDYGLTGENPEAVAQLASWMLDADIPKVAAQKLAAKMAEGGQAMSQAQSDAAARRSESEFNDLKKEWGAAFDQKAELGRRFARELGLDGDALAAIEGAIGTKRLLTMMAAGGERLGEHTIAGLESGRGGAMTPEAAKARIVALRDDKEWSDSYIAGGKAEADEMAKLIRWSNGMA